VDTVVVFGVTRRAKLEGPFALTRVIVRGELAVPTPVRRGTPVSEQSIPVATTEAEGRHRLVRYALVAAIVRTAGGPFAYREGTSPDEVPVVAGRQVEVGEPAPAFTLATPDGEVSLPETRGEIVVLNFWATWCALSLRNARVPGPA